jgi:hypothetical protein
VPRFITYVSWLQLTYVMNLGTFCPLEKNWHILTPIDEQAMSLLVLQEKKPPI